jgi:hypothetical protein
MRRWRLTGGDACFYFLGLFRFKRHGASQNFLELYPRNKEFPMSPTGKSMFREELAFGWRPPETKRVRLFFYEMERSKL